MKVQSTSAKQPPDAVRLGECLGEMFGNTQYRVSCIAPLGYE